MYRRLHTSFLIGDWEGGMCQVQRDGMPRPQWQCCPESVLCFTDVCWGNRKILSASSWVWVSPSLPPHASIPLFSLHVSLVSPATAHQTDRSSWGLNINITWTFSLEGIKGTDALVYTTYFNIWKFSSIANNLKGPKRTNNRGGQKQPGLLLNCFVLHVVPGRKSPRRW